MDFYAADGDTVEPLPFQLMGTYPYPEESRFRWMNLTSIICSTTTRDMFPARSRGAIVRLSPAQVAIVGDGIVLTFDNFWHS